VNGKRFAAHRLITSEERDLHAAGPHQDVTSVRAKSRGHGRKTADKWNR
jgi:hypothetical protein